MARALRIEYEGAFYHVFNRGLERKQIFRAKKDFDDFLKILTNLTPRFGFRIYAFCLMPNHYHFYLETPKPNLSKFMKELNGLHTQAFNRRYKRVGPLFQGRYKALLVDKDNYSLELARYIHLNPVKAKLVDDPEDYPYSSYPVYVSKRKPWVFLHPDFLRRQFRTQDDFKRFTMEKGVRSLLDFISLC